MKQRDSSSPATKVARTVPDGRTPSRRSTHVPGQYRGYSLQADRFLHHLLIGRPGWTVSLEVIGDTGIEFPDGSSRTEEAKSRTRGANPIGDRSTDLWKTLRNWVEAAQSGRLDPSTTQFRLFVSRPFKGQLVQRFHEASTQYEALRAIKSAFELLGIVSPQQRGESPRVPSSLAKELRSHLEVIVSAPPRLLAAIITNFQTELGSGHTIDDLKGVASATFIPPEIAGDVLQHVTGWLKAQIDEQIDRGQAACVRWEDFRTAVTTSVRLLDRRDVLSSVARDPTDVEVEEHLRFRTYVKQLDLIEVDFDEQLRAVTDFVKAETDRTVWAEKGRVIEASFEEFEEALIASWRNYKRRCDIVHTDHPEPKRGQLLYTDCCEHRTKLGGADVPSHFCRGSFHKLADDPAIGWHPNYERLLATDALTDEEAAPSNEAQPNERARQSRRRIGDRR